MDDIAQRYALGQPVLVGTISIETSEYFSEQLQKKAYPPIRYSTPNTTTGKRKL